MTEQEQIQVWKSGSTKMLWMGMGIEETQYVSLNDLIKDLAH